MRRRALPLLPGATAELRGVFRYTGVTRALTPANPAVTTTDIHAFPLPPAVHVSMCMSMRLYGADGIQVNGQAFDTPLHLHHVVGAFPVFH